jgi:RNA polymerase sigma-70 factor (ECF subfamily)
MPPSNDPARESEDLREAEAVFRAARGRLFGIAYRMLGSAGEAEDLLQEVWIRWQTCDRSAVRNPQAFLATATTRLAINVLQSARVRRETYVGPWLPEPVDTSADPALGAERGEALEVAVLMLLEKLTPTERAAYVLREAFDYPYEQIAQAIGQTQANARQLVSRAKKHLAAEGRVRVTPAEHRRLLGAFTAAARRGDVDALQELFAADVVSYTDGGGAVRRASKIPVVGRLRVARYYRAFAGTFWGGVTEEPIEVNGLPGVRLSRDGKFFAVVTVTATEEGIERVWWMMNPHKLGAVDS